MKGKATQNRFLRFLALPMRCLSRTRDCYINGMNNYAVVNQPKAPSRVQRSYSVSSQGSNDSEDYRELLKAASMRGMEGLMLSAKHHFIIFIQILLVLRNYHCMPTNPLNQTAPKVNHDNNRAVVLRTTFLYSKGGLFSIAFIFYKRNDTGANSKKDVPKEEK
nr:uncharacterized protein LOC104096343 [Ipomoea trifida]GMD84944.1 uncharacterized protein LOC104096343 [Ipomoea batatas]